MSDAIYLDHHATTPLDPRVLDAMLPYFREKFGNAASRSHAFGWAAEQAVEGARESVAALLATTAAEIVFTSGATEANNLALLGARLQPGDHVVTSAVEHPSVLEPCRVLEQRGVRVTRVGVDGRGSVDVAAVAAALAEGAALVSVLLASNEIGTLQPIAEISRLARAGGALVHCDAAQAVGKIPVDVEALDVDMLSLSAHKLHGPKGAGALHVRARPRRVRLSPLVHGGGQERGLRPGTQDVPAIVGLGRACEIARAEMAEDAVRIRALRDRLQARLLAGIRGAHVNGREDQRLPGNLSVSIEGADAEEILLAAPQVAMSVGSACSSGSTKPSHVLRAIGLSDELCRGTLRLGLGRFTTEAEVERAADLLIAAAAGAARMG